MLHPIEHNLSNMTKNNYTISDPGSDIFNSKAMAGVVGQKNV